MKKYEILIAYTLAIAVVISSLTMCFNFLQIRNFLYEQRREVKIDFDRVDKLLGRTSNVIFQRDVDIPQIISLFKRASTADEKQMSKIRTELYNLLKDKYKELQKQDISQIHFHLPNNQSFLRMSHPDKFGDDLGDTRLTVAFVSKYKKPISGFEVGKGVREGYRYVYPMFDEDNNYIGSAEVSSSLFAIKKVFENTKDSIATFALREDIVNAESFQELTSNYTRCAINPHFYLPNSILAGASANAQNEALKDFSFCSTMSKNMDKMQEFSNYQLKNFFSGYINTVDFIPIKAAVSGKPVGYLIYFRRSETLFSIYMIFIYQMLSGILFAFMLAYILWRRKLEMLSQSVENVILKRKATTDKLTDLNNRHAFVELLHQETGECRRSGEAKALIMFDIDDFKTINDLHGHDIGDDTLFFLAQLIKNSLRSTDIPCRWGGEEFMIFTPESLTRAKRLAEHLRKKIEEESIKSLYIPRFTCSFGVVDLNKYASLDDAYKAVDDLLYTAKHNGKNRVEG